MTETLSICQRIDLAYADIAKETFTKSGQVKGGSASYNFIPIGQLLSVVRQAHSRYGVKTIFSRPLYDKDQGEFRREYTSEKTAPYDGHKYTVTEYYAVGHIHVILMGSSPDDVIETDIGFECKDNSDKLNNKIYTNAERSLYRTLYAIDEGSPDPEEVCTENVALKRVPAQPTTPKAAPKTAKPASDAKRPIAFAHLSAGYKPLPDGATRSMGPDWTGRAPEADGRVHLRSAREIDEQQVMRCYHSIDGAVVAPFVKTNGADIKTWSDDALSQALNAMAAADLLDGA